MRTAFTDLVGVDQPLVGFNRSPGVVAEVSKAGGLGVLAATAYRPDELDAQLTWIEEQTGGAPYGVDLLVPTGTIDGDPSHLVASLRSQIPQRHLDFVAGLLGTEAGGHTGTIATMVLAPEIVEVAGPAPVLAAGGIASGAQLAASLALGAAGAWCGSVWLSTIEDITPGPIKHKLLAAGSHSTVRSRTRTGKPARQLRSAWHDAWNEPDAPEPLPMPLQVLLAKDAWVRQRRGVT